MNAFDYFFEHTSRLEKNFLVGKEEISYRELYDDCNKIASWLTTRVGQNKNILILSGNNVFFLKAYLAIIKSGNICIPLDPNIEKNNFDYINDLTNPLIIFLTEDVAGRLNVSNMRCIFPSEIIEIEESLAIDLFLLSP